MSNSNSDLVRFTTSASSLMVSPCTQTDDSSNSVAPAVPVIVEYGSIEVDSTSSSTSSNENFRRARRSSRQRQQRQASGSGRSTCKRADAPTGTTRTPSKVMKSAKDKALKDSMFGGKARPSSRDADLDLVARRGTLPSTPLVKGTVPVTKGEKLPIQGPTSSAPVASTTADVATTMRDAKGELSKASGTSGDAPVVVRALEGDPAATSVLRRTAFPQIFRSQSYGPIQNRVPRSMLSSPVGTPRGRRSATKDNQRMAAIEDSRSTALQQQQAIASSAAASSLQQ